MIVESGIIKIEQRSIANHGPDPCDKPRQLDNGDFFTCRVVPYGKGFTVFLKYFSGVNIGGKRKSVPIARMVVRPNGGTSTEFPPFSADFFAGSWGF